MFVKLGPNRFVEMDSVSTTKLVSDSCDKSIDIATFRISANKMAMSRTIKMSFFCYFLTVIDYDDDNSSNAPTIIQIVQMHKN